MRCCTRALTGCVGRAGVVREGGLRPQRDVAQGVLSPEPGHREVRELLPAAVEVDQACEQGGGQRDGGAGACEALQDSRPITIIIITITASFPIHEQRTSVSDGERKARRGSPAGVS